MNSQKIKAYMRLMRLHKPIGILLLLWPTLWALWLVGAGCGVMSIFVLGVILMRSAGCVINDFADRYVDGHVQRTRDRPIVTGEVTSHEAITLFCVLSVSAFLLALLLNTFTILLTFVGAALAVFYPFMKRFTNLPQFGLGLAFSWGVPMAFAAQINAVPFNAWLLFFTAALWPVIYDTMYAMADRQDDLKIGVKSTAILFSQHDTLIIGFFQIFFLLFLSGVGFLFQLHMIYYVSLVGVLVLFGYQQWLMKDRNGQRCFQAFLNNHWVGLFIFLGIVLGSMK